MQEELRRTLLLYAIAPLLALLSLGGGLMYVYWHEHITGRNQAAREAAAAHLERTLAAARGAAEALAADCDVARLKTDEAYRVQVSRALYGALNREEAQSLFLVLDERQEVVLSSRARTPALSRFSRGAFWGIVQRLWAEPSRTICEFTRTGTAFGRPWDAAVGRAVEADGAAAGCVLFVLDGSALLTELVDARANIVVEDAFGHTPLCTDYNFSERLSGRLHPRFHGADGAVHFGAGDYYVSRAALSEDALTVYAITPLGELRAYARQAGGALLLAVLLMIALLLRASRRIARRQTRHMDAVVRAFAAARGGDFSCRLAIEGPEELSALARSYNVMVESLARLMAESEAKTRASVLLELEQLTSQFDPHFLYNTLGSIKFMITLRPQAAQEMTQALSRLLRYSIRSASASVTLAEDMERLYDYLAIMQYRFGERFEYEITADPSAEAALVPKLLLQPVIENALKYGMEKRTALFVRVAIARVPEGLSISVEDNGGGMGEEALLRVRAFLAGEAPPQGHAGLYNVHRRVQLLYGAAYGVSVESREGRGTTVLMRLPLALEKGGNGGVESADRGG